MKTGRPKGPEKVLFRKRVMPEVAEKLKKLCDGEWDVISIGPEDVPVGSLEPYRVSRILEENHRLDQSLAERESEATEMRGEIVRLKEQRKAEENPSLPAEENIRLRKRIKELQAGILKDAEKMERMETLLSMMVDWELPIFESWQTGKRNELMNQKNDQAVYDQDVSN